MGVARDNVEAALIATGPQGDRPPPQLYSAPDPEEDHEAERAMENLAYLALQAQSVVSAGNTVLNATQVVLNQTRDFFLHGALPMAGLDELDLFLLKKIGMLSHCGFENNMKIVTNNITDELMCAMRVHLMNESEIHVFCPKDALVWEENCMNVEFMNFTAISEPNEMLVINALRDSIYGLLESYPSTAEEDLEIIERNFDELEPGIGPVTLAAIQLRYREKQVLYSGLKFLEEHESKVKNGSVLFQLAIKAQERLEADIRAAEYKKFVEEVKAKAAIPEEIAFVEVDMGADMPKVNLTLEEGRDIKETVKAFCLKHGVKANYVPTLEEALRQRVVNPLRLQLQLGVVTPIGERMILAIPEGANATVETAVFCAKNDMSKDAAASDWCKALIERVEERLNSTALSRKILVVIPIDAPDSRKLQLVVREGEQHDLLQFTTDFLQLYKMPVENALMLANEVLKRLPPTELQIPVGLSAQRQVSLRLTAKDNVVETVDAFMNYFELRDPEIKIAILKRAHHGMAPGTFMKP